MPWYGDGEGWTTTTELLRVEANYLLLQEHYLDLTDVFVMHPEAVPPDIERLPQLDEVEVSERSVAYFRELPSSRLAPWEAEITGLPTETAGIRREEGIFVSPALHVQHYAIEPEGGPAYGLLRIQGFTPNPPASPTSSYGWPATLPPTTAKSASSYGRSFTTGRCGMPLLQTIQQRLDEDIYPRRDINVKADRAAIRARRIAMEMVDEESGRFALNRILNASG